MPTTFFATAVGSHAVAGIGESAADIEAVAECRRPLTSHGFGVEVQYRLVCPWRQRFSTALAEDGRRRGIDQNAALSFTTPLVITKQRGKAIELPFVPVGREDFGEAR